jgi:hypothetical protein
MAHEGSLVRVRLICLLWPDINFTMDFFLCRFASPVEAEHQATPSPKKHTNQLFSAALQMIGRVCFASGNSYRHIPLDEVAPSKADAGSLRESHRQVVSGETQKQTRSQDKKNILQDQAFAGRYLTIYWSSPACLVQSKPDAWG